MLDAYWPELVALLQVVVIDLVLAGDNAIVVGMAVAGLPDGQKSRAILVGIGVATVLRIGLALVTLQLLAIVGLLLAGGVLLLWVCWRMYRELRPSGRTRDAFGGVAPKTLRQAMMQIVLADLSMSLDNVLAVAGAAREHPWVLVAGLGLSVVLMGGGGAAGGGVAGAVSLGGLGGVGDRSLCGFEAGVGGRGGCLGARAGASVGYRRLGTAGSAWAQCFSTPQKTGMVVARMPSRLERKAERVWNWPALM